MELLGYTTWGCIDLVSFYNSRAQEEIWLHIQLIDMDDGRGTLERYKKKSFYWYKKVIGNKWRKLKNNL